MALHASEDANARESADVPQTEGVVLGRGWSDREFYEFFIKKIIFSSENTNILISLLTLWSFKAN